MDEKLTRIARRGCKRDARSPTRSLAAAKDERQKRKREEEEEEEERESSQSLLLFPSVAHSFAQFAVFLSLLCSQIITLKFILFCRFHFLSDLQPLRLNMLSEKRRLYPPCRKSMKVIGSAEFCSLSHGETRCSPRWHKEEGRG
jgi:hypothetical protein